MMAAVSLLLRRPSAEPLSIESGGGGITSSAEWETSRMFVVFIFGPMTVE